MVRLVERLPCRGNGSSVRLSEGDGCAKICQGPVLSTSFDGAKRAQALANVLLCQRFPRPPYKGPGEQTICDELLLVSVSLHLDGLCPSPQRAELLLPTAQRLWTCLCAERPARCFCWSPLSVLGCPRTNQLSGIPLPGAWPCNTWRPSPRKAASLF